MFRPTRRRVLSSVIALVVCAWLHPPAAWASAPAKEKAEATAFRRLAALQRGVNLSGWFGGWGEYTTEHLTTYVTPADLAFLRASGLTYVRFPVDPVFLSAGGYDSPASVAAVAQFDRALDEILAAGLSVQVTAFPKSDYKKALLTPEGASAYIGFWKFMAAHLAGRDPERVFFDLMNEPELTDAAVWNKLQEDTAEAIRSVEKDHTLIASGAKYDGIDELLQVKPLKDRNVVYTFHFYEPFPFTHQGATWGSPEWTHLQNVPYPADPEKLGPMIASMNDPTARNMLADYASGGWDDSVIRHRLKQARTWADTNHVPVIANEFGAFRDTAPPEARARYLRDVRTGLESLNIPWAAWDYRGNFGFVTYGPDHSIVPDGAIMTALGLTVPAASTTPVAPPAGAPPAGAAPPSPGPTN